MSVLEMVRPALRLLRSLKKFAEKIDASYRLHGLGNAIITIQEEAGEALSAVELVALYNGSTALVLPCPGRNPVADCDDVSRAQALAVRFHVPERPPDFSRSRTVSR